MPHSKTSVTRHHCKWRKNQGKISVYHKACNTDLQASIKSLKSIFLFIQFFPILRNFWIKNYPKKYSTCLKIQKLLTRDDQANLQPTLNKEVRVSQFLSLILENSLRSQVLRINYVINYFHHSKKKKKKKLLTCRKSGN